MSEGLEHFGTAIEAYYSKERQGRQVIRAPVSKPEHSSDSRLNAANKKIRQLETEINQLKRGMRADQADWENMVGAQLNEVKFRQFKANLVAHKKLCQLIAGKLGKMRDKGLTGPECLTLAEEIEPDHWSYTSKSSVERLKNDITKLLTKCGGETNEQTHRRQRQICNEIKNDGEDAPDE